MGALIRNGHIPHKSSKTIVFFLKHGGEETHLDLCRKLGFVKEMTSYITPALILEDKASYQLGQTKDDWKCACRKHPATSDTRKKLLYISSNLNNEVLP